jgi:hypothetical protein
VPGRGVKLLCSGLLALLYESSNPPKASIPNENMCAEVCWSAQRASGSASALDFATAHDAGLAFAAGVTIAEGKSVAVDLAPKIAVGINDENLLVILAAHVTDHGLFRLSTASGKGLDSPEAPTLLAGDLNDEVPFREERLFERAGTGRPMSARAPLPAMME